MDSRAERYAEVERAIASLIGGEADAVAVWATAVAELHHAFDHYHWTGVYRVDREGGPRGGELVIGPYQGGHGCLRIPFERGVCGAAARTRATQRVPDVEAFPGHIACSATTRSELVVPVITPRGRLLAVIDVDSDLPDAFGDADVAGLERIAARLAAHLERMGNQ
jgi:GAF domain-containing protein